jgi:oligoendopeptidase F
MSHPRKNISDNDKWNLTVLYESDNKWYDDYNEIKNLKDLQPILQLKTKLKQITPKELYNFFKDMDDIELKLENLYMYAHLKNDEDLSNNDYNEMYDKIKTVHTEYGKQTSWFVPELIKMSKIQLTSLINSEELSDYKFMLDKIIFNKDHVLSDELEEFIAQSGNVMGAGERIFSMMNNVNLKFGSVLDSEGNKHELTHGTYNKYMQSRDRTLRKNAFMKTMHKYNKYKEVFAESLKGVLYKHKLMCNSRNFNSCLEVNLKPKKIDTKVYHNLIKITRDNIHVLHKYLKLKSKLSKQTSDLHLYDLYVPLANDISFDGSILPKECTNEPGKLHESPNHTDHAFKYEDAVDIVLCSVKVLGKEYHSAAQKGLRTDNWVDKYENKGKRSGAYSSGSYTSHPYILMNYNGTLNSVFTLAHELGHSMHSYFSNKTQPYQHAGYDIFIAEVASTFNEISLIKFLLKHLKEVKYKKYLLNKFMEMIRTTFYRQVLFADFELQMHKFAESGTPITPKLLMDTYYDLYKFYYGVEGIIVDEEIASELFRIPHLYYNFYVYQYATGIAASFYLNNKVLGDKTGKSQKEYLKFLTLGGSVYPLDALKIAGVDMTSKEPILDLIQFFDKLIDEFEELL